MSGRVGSITTDIISDGLYFHLDAANRASYPKKGTKSHNTVSPISGSFINDTFVDYSVGKGVFSFDGADDAILLEGTTTSDSWLVPSNSTEPFSISSWFNTNTVSSTSWVISAGSNGGTNWDIKIGATSGKITFRMRYLVGSPYYSDLLSSTISTNTWYNVTGVFTGTQQLLYLNGVQESTANITFYRGISSQIYGAIGCFFYNGVPWSGDFNGEIGPISFYKSKALSANEALHNYNALKGRFGL